MTAFESNEQRVRLSRTSRRTAERIAGFAVLAAIVTCALLVWPGFLHGGAAYVIVSGNSMDPTLHGGDLVLTVRRSGYDVGDVVAYRIPKGQPGAGVLVIHRIVGGSASSGYIMQGDNRAGRDPWRPRSQDVVGAQGLTVPRLGLALVYLRTPIGLASLAGIVTALFILVGSGTDGPPKPAAAKGGSAARSRRRGSVDGRHNSLAPAPIEVRARLTDRQRHGNAFPIALARSWGEASWTARDLRMLRAPTQTMTGVRTDEALEDVGADAASAEPNSKRRPTRVSSSSSPVAV